MSQILPGATLAVHADWSVDAPKRWMALARLQDFGWIIEAPVPVGPVAEFLPGLLAWNDKAAGGVALGVDLPLGLPRAYATLLPDTDFTAFLRRLEPGADFFRVCGELSELHAGRPFYPMRGVQGMTRAAHANALGFAGPAGLSRTCDHATADRPAGAPLFWTLGANQTGKAAIAAWRDMLLPAIAAGLPIRLWPFEGDFLALLAPGTITFAETYPAEAMRHLGVTLSGSKRRQSDRAACAGRLRDAMLALSATPCPLLAAMIETGFGADAAGEDRFDCLLGVLCVINVLAGNRPDTIPDDPWLRKWEGWVLGQSVPPPYPA